MILLVDCCFIIELLIRYPLGDKHFQHQDMNWKTSLLRRDIILLENHIPFFVLQALFDSSINHLFHFEDSNQPLITLIVLALSFIIGGRLDKMPKSVSNVDI